MTYLELFQAEIDANNVTWCKACDAKNSHHRGFAVKDTRTIHLDRKVSTRSTLHRALHEVGHIVNDETGMRRWQQEEAANDYAEKRLRELGIPVPRGEAAKGRKYVARMKRWGKNISKSK